MNRDSVSKLAASQNIIRNKFENALTNRLRKENDMNDAMKPLTSSHPLTTSSAQKSIDLEYKNNPDPNTLCDNLRTLLASSNHDDVKSMQQINTILDELRRLGIM